jgi:hypothetical protein
VVPRIGSGVESIRGSVGLGEESSQEIHGILTNLAISGRAVGGGTGDTESTSGGENGSLGSNLKNETKKQSE